MRKTVKQTRQTRIRARVKGVAAQPRLSVFRSNKYVYAQVIDDETKKTIVGATEKELSLKEKLNKSERAKELGKLIAKKAITKKIEKVVFDRGSYRYHGRVKAIADGAREGGLKF
jgi:large subunit ribosomal protein L18